MEKNSEAKEKNMISKGIIRLILVLGITVLSACTIKGNDTDMESQKVNDSAENELGSEGLPSETDTAGLQGTENTNGEQSGSTVSKQDEKTSSGMIERYKAILLGDEDFVNIDHSDQDISLNIENIKEVVSDEDWVTAKVIKFTVIDLDGNGENEIVLWIQSNGGSDYGFEILYFQDQEVYGFTLPYRGFMDLKTDGTFYSSGGMDNRGIRRLRLSERGYTIEEVSESESKEEKADVEWYDLSPDNVELAFENKF